MTGTGQDTVAGPVFDNIVDQDVGASFMSFVYPRGQLRLAAFRHEPIRVDQGFESSGVFQNRNGVENRDTGVTASRTLAIDSYGGAVAYQTPHVWVPLPKAKIGLAYKRGAQFEFSCTSTPFPFTSGFTSTATFRTPARSRSAPRR